MIYDLKIQESMIQWMDSFDWNVFGTLNFALNQKPILERAHRTWSRFWNKVDRQCFGQSASNQVRIPRFVYTHTGANGDNPHMHFLAQIPADVPEFCIALNFLWFGMDGAATAIPEQNEILPLIDRSRAARYLTHEDAGHSLEGFNARLSHLPEFAPEMRPDAIRRLVFAGNANLEVLERASIAYESQRTEVRARYNRRHAN